MNTSELCVWECQGTIRDTLGTSALTRTGHKPPNLDRFLGGKKNNLSPQNELAL